MPVFEKNVYLNIKWGVSEKTQGGCMSNLLSCITPKTGNIVLIASVINFCHNINLVLIRFLDEGTNAGTQSQFRFYCISLYIILVLV